MMLTLTTPSRRAALTGRCSGDPSVAKAGVSAEPSERVQASQKEKWLYGFGHQEKR
jgi:hypothetical protein